MQNAINWFEIPAADFQRAVKFYNTIFGVKMHTQNMMGYEMGFFPSEQGAVGGAIICGEGREPCTKGTLIYLNGGEDLSGPLSRVEKAGGKVLRPKTVITPEIGYYAQFMDTEGNKIAIHSAK